MKTNMKRRILSIFMVFLLIFVSASYAPVYAEAAMYEGIIVVQPVNSNLHIPLVRFPSTFSGYTPDILPLRLINRGNYDIQILNIWLENNEDNSPSSFFNISSGDFIVLVGQENNSWLISQIAGLDTGQYFADICILYLDETGRQMITAVTNAVRFQVR